MKKTKIFIPIFLGIILMSSLFLTPSVNATISYYNHLQNPSFFSTSDYVENGGFESGQFEDAVLYGNWTVGSGNFNLTKPHTGQYSYQVNTVTSYLQYNFTSNYYTLGSDIEDFRFYVFFDHDNGYIEVAVVFYYTDDTVTSSKVNCDFGVWTLWNTPNINSAKVVKAFNITGAATVDTYYDDFVLLVDDGGGQDLIGANTVPWRRVMDPNIWAFIGLKDDFGRLDNSSAYFYNLGESGYIIQDINFLDVDFVHFADLYYYVVDPIDMSLQFTVEYDDGSSSNSIKTIDINSTWTYLNFGNSFIGSNKNIIRISVRIFSGSGSKIVHIDDVGLWASVVAGYSRFEFTVTPSPIGQSSNSLWISTGIQYTMLCYLYDDSSSLSFNGTVKIFDSTGETITTMTNGMFSYIIIPRSYVSDTVENFVFQIICDNDNIYTVLLVVIFDYVASDIVTPVTPTQTTDFMFLFIFIVIPSMFLAVILKPVGIPIIGFLSGLTIMTSIGRAVGIIDLWFLFVMVLVCVLIILSMMKRGLYT